MNKKFKYGATSIVFTVIVIAAVIIVNIVFSALSNTYRWSADMTRANLYTLSDATFELLDGNINKEITINFCQPLDQLQADQASDLVYNCAMEYAARYDNVKVDCLDIITNPSLVKKYSNSSNTAIKTTSVVVTSDTDYRTFTLDSFFSYDSDSKEVVAFNAEEKFSTAIMQLCSDQPLAYFITGHGESVGSEGNRTALWNLFVTAGYEVKEINLSTQDFDGKAQVAIINGPKKDLEVLGEDVNEVKKIGDFLKGLGNLMVFLDPETPSLPELEGLLEEWGIAVEDALIKDSKQSVSSDGTKLVATYTEDNFSSSLHSEIRALDSIPKTIVDYARPLKCIWSKGTSMIGLARREVGAILRSSPNAKAYSYEDNGELTLTSPFDLMLVSRETSTKSGVDDFYYSYVFVTGTTKFANDSYLYNEAYANDEILYSAMRVMGKDTVPNNISYKFLEDESLDITQEQANNWTVFITVFAPIVIFGIGLYVQIRRKHL